MNPSVVAAHKRIGLLQSSTSGKGKPWKDAKVHGQDGVDHSSPLKGGSTQEPHRASSFEPREGEDNSRREGGRALRPDAPARPPDSIESKQRKLNSIELRVELTWRSPCLRTLDSSTIQRPTRTSPRPTGPPTTASSKHSSTKAKEATPTFEDEEEEEEEPQARSSEANPVEWSP
ncbi:unnamed protein product [Microthlaspi erraticum]|uniref:Uncharacterized protein n=1 Tax=Microthlaspi erraticum TaxID=1685480 RepID=A0A6D2K2L1_9BRAS|nr:unnamed protein product [Microthlaspi erraticum]